ncbi:hypothetical protein ANTRET_LOCUS7555 [Anthophora retusa]
MESFTRAGRNVSSGVYRVAGAFARGARRVLSYVPLLGVAAIPPEVDDDSNSSVGGEEAENGSATAGSPVEEKLAVSSPTAENESASVEAATTPSTEAKEESSPASAVNSPTEEKTEEPTPSAPTPVPVEEKKEEVEKVEAEKKVVEVSPAGGQFVPEPVEVSVFRVQTVATPSIIERKTSEDIPSLPPSSPPPTPIDSSPLQQAQQAVATATALAEAFKLPAEAADKDFVASPPTLSALSSLCSERNDPSTPAAESLAATAATPLPPPPQRPISSSADEPRTESTIVVAPSVEARPVAYTDTSDPPPVSTEAFESSFSAGDGNRAATSEVAQALLPGVENNDAITDVLAKEQDPSVSQSSNKEEEEGVIEVNVTKETVLEKSSASPVVETKKVVEEKIEPPCEVVASEKVPSVEQPVASSDSVVLLDLTESAPSIQNETSEVVVEDIVKEESAESKMTKVPEPVSIKEPKELVEQVIEPNQVVQEEIERVEEAVVDPINETTDVVVDTEEGPMPVSEEILVEAKPAVVIPEDEEETTEDIVIEEVADTEEMDVSKLETASVEVIPDLEDKLELETESDIAVPTEEILISEEPEDLDDPFVSNDEAIVDPVQPIVDCTIENPVEEVVIVPESKDEKKEEEEESLPPPPPLPESPVPSPQEKYDPENVTIADDSKTVPSPIVDVKDEKLDVEQKQEVDGSPLSLPEHQIEASNEPSIEEVPAAAGGAAAIPKAAADDASLQILDNSSCSINEKIQSTCPANESQTHFSSSRLEHVLPSPSDDLPPPAPEETIQTIQEQHIDPIGYPLPPEELSRPVNVSEMESELPVPDENAAPSLRNPTETLLTPPRSPSPQSNVSITSGLTTSTKDSSQTQLYDDQSNREFKMESVSISLNSYNESDIELKERLAESLAETEKQEESSVSCQLSNNATSSTTVQETHQSTPESEAPVENNVDPDSTTESSEPTTIVTSTPAVPWEMKLAPPPSAAVFIDVATSVAKVIEGIEISHNAAIGCDTKEIIADADYKLCE